MPEKERSQRFFRRAASMCDDIVYRQSLPPCDAVENNCGHVLVLVAVSHRTPCQTPIMKKCGDLALPRRGARRGRDIVYRQSKLPCDVVQTIVAGPLCRAGASQNMPRVCMAPAPAVVIGEP